MKRRKWNAARALGADDLDRGVERDQRLREIPGIGGDAMLAPAEHRVRSIEAVQRGAARTRVSLVARGVGDIAKVDAPRALQYIAAKARHVADLLARRELERLRDHWIVAANRGMLCGVRHAGQGAEAKPAAPGFEEPKHCSVERVNIDHLLGPHHI